MPTKTQVLFLMAPGCAHCPGQLSILCELMEQGRLGRLDVVNIAEHPEIAAEAGTRSVPWMRIGPFELSGSHTAEEIDRWVDRANRGAGMADYFSELLSQGGLAQVQALLRRDPSQLPALIELLASPDTPIAVRVGVDAILEDLEGTPELRALIPAFGKLTQAREPQIRTDASHYLGLTHDPAAGQYLRPLLEDNDPDVRETAEESLLLLPN